MSSKHAKPGTNKPHPQPDNTGAQHNKRDVTGSIQVRGEIETHIPADLVEKRAAAEEKNDARDKFRLRIEVTGLIFVIIYAGLTALIAFESYKAATSSELAAKISSDQLVLFERPWIAPDLGKEPPIFIGDGKKAHVTWLLWFKNFGTSPALNVRWRVRHKVVETTTVNYQAWQNELDSLPISADQPAYSVMTGQRIPDDGDFGFVYDPQFKSENVTGHRMLVIEGKITFSDSLNSSHLTTFCYFYVPANPSLHWPEGWGICPIASASN